MLTAKPHILPVLFAPRDTVPDDRLEALLMWQMGTSQTWYRERVGQTFVFVPPVLVIGRERGGAYNSSPSSWGGYFQTAIGAELRDREIVPWCDPNVIIYVYVNSRHYPNQVVGVYGSQWWCTSGDAGRAMDDIWMLNAMLGQQSMDKLSTPGRCIHELGHCFGLPDLHYDNHAAEVVQGSIMGSPWKYDKYGGSWMRTDGLHETEKATLRQSKWFWL